MRCLVFYDRCHNVLEKQPADIQTGALAENVSTDEIYPVRYFFTTEDFGRVAMTGFRTGDIELNDLKQWNCDRLICGRNMGCGSAREHAAVTLLDAGVRLVCATSFNSVFRRNLINCGCIPTTSLELAFSERIDVDAVPDLSADERKIIKNGGLMACPEFSTTLKNKSQQERAHQTLVEKILSDASDTKCSADDLVTVKPDLLFFYDIHTPLIKRVLGESPVIHSNVLAFDDHFGGNPEYINVLKILDDFTKRNHIRACFTRKKAGGVCHAVILANYARPGQLIVGTDSHTSTCGTNCALGLAVGATDMAVAMKYGKLNIQVPKSIRVNFCGTLSNNCSMKDVMLYFMCTDLVSQAKTKGRFFEFDVSGIHPVFYNQLQGLCNMATEAGAWGGIIFSEDSKQELRPDAEAVYDQEITIDLNRIEPALAFPHNPANYRPLSSITGPIEIQKAFIGSCTGGLLDDMEVASTLLKGNIVSRTLQLFVQPASYAVYKKAAQAGYLSTIEEAGACVLAPGCGGCIGQFPAAIGPGENGVWNSNRNYQGRIGSAQGSVYLASTKTVTRAALRGCLSADLYD